MKIVVSIELGDDETPLSLAAKIEETLKQQYAKRRVLVGDGTGLYRGDDRKLTVIHF